MIRYLIILSACVSALTFVSMAAADSDLDGLLDLVDAPGFDPLARERLSFTARGIEDLDGAAQLTQLQILGLGFNSIKSIERNDFKGLESLRYLYLFDNGIREIESYAFEGLNLRDLNLNGNAFRELNLEGVRFDQLFHLGIDRFDVKHLRLDNALLSRGSFDEIVNETTEITSLSLVGLRFSGAPPLNLEQLLGNASLTHVVVDSLLYGAYHSDFEEFRAVQGNLLTVVLTGDCNRDGFVNAGDLTCIRSVEERDQVLAAIPAKLGDFDGDGKVNFHDFLVLAANFGRLSGRYVDGNVDLMDGVTFNDFLILAANFGMQPMTGASSSEPLTAERVPEPASVGLVLSCCVVLVTLRQRLNRRPGGW